MHAERIRQLPDADEASRERRQRETLPVTSVTSESLNIFNLPGLGRLMLIALNERDYPMVSGINLFFATGGCGIQSRY